MYGRVTRYFQDRGYGFVLGEDRETYYIYRSNLRGEHIVAMIKSNFSLSVICLYLPMKYVYHIQDAKSIELSRCFGYWVWEYCVP